MYNRMVFEVTQITSNAIIIRLKFSYVFLHLIRNNSELLRVKQSFISIYSYVK